MIPKLGIIALGRVVMEHEKVADPLKLEIHPIIVFRPFNSAIAALRKKLQELGYTFLDQINTGRFERFEEPSCKTNRHHIAVPQFAALASNKAQHSWVSQRLSFERRHQGFSRSLIAQKLTRIDMAIAGAVLQWDAPLPACLMGCCSRKGDQRTCAFARHGHRSVCGKELAPILVTGGKCAFDQ